MANIYTQYLQSPSTSHLADDATLVYVTTTTEIREPTAILKHLNAQAKQIEVKENKVLNVIDGQDGVAVETETTLQFKLGGGTYLPGMDENLLDERVVTFPMTHFVRFEQQKIKSIRLYWDQGTLLKQVEAIGKTGRNWPIREGKAQVDAVSKSVKSAGQSAGAPTAAGKPRGPHDVVIDQHRKRESVSATRDPHASLSLFTPRDPNEDEGSLYNGPTFAPRQSAKPAPRDFVDIAGDEPEPPPGSSVRSPSPTKDTKLKSGAGKNYITNRLFDHDDVNEASRSPERRKKTYDQKYEHFDFGDGEDAPQQSRPVSNRGNKNQASFSFEDFHTPPKAKEQTRKDYERHWGAGVDEDDPPSPAKRPVVHAARPDAEPHFTIADEMTPEAKPKSHMRQKGMGLYQDPLNDDPHAKATEKTRRNMTADNARRDDELSAHYKMGDSPAPDVKGKENHLPNHPKVGKVRSDLESHWGFGTPEPEKKIYKTAGDGMGGRGGMARSWGIGDESDPEVDVDANVRATARSRAGRNTSHTQAGAEY